MPQHASIIQIPYKLYSSQKISLKHFNTLSMQVAIVSEAKYKNSARKDGL